VAAPPLRRPVEPASLPTDIVGSPVSHPRDLNCVRCGGTDQLADGVLRLENPAVRTGKYEVVSCSADAASSKPCRFTTRSPHGLMRFGNRPLVFHPDPRRTTREGPAGRHRAPFGTWGQLARIDTNPHWPEGLMSMHITWGCGSWDVHRNVFVALAFLLDEAVLLRYPRGRSRGR
jgi:hypothetical protein